MIKDLDRPTALTRDEVYSKTYCEVGDKVSVKSTNKKSLENQVRGEYIPKKGKVVAIYPTFIHFTTGVYDFCLDKTDLYTGMYKIRKVKR